MPKAILKFNLPEESEEEHKKRCLVKMLDEFFGTTGFDQYRDDPNIEIIAKDIDGSLASVQKERKWIVDLLSQGGATEQVLSRIRNILAGPDGLQNKTFKTTITTYGWVIDSKLVTCSVLLFCVY